MVLLLLTRIKYFYLAVKIAVDSQSCRAQDTLKISLWCITNEASTSEAIQYRDYMRVNIYVGSAQSQLRVSELL